MSAAEPLPITEWDPTPILNSERLVRGKPYRFSLIILNQPIHNIPLFLDLWRRATVRIAADGGANRVYVIRAHLEAAAARETSTTTAESFPKLDFIVGDLDSLEDETRAWFLSQWQQQQQQRQAGPHAGAGAADANADIDVVGQIIQDDDQYSTDFAKAVKHARELARLRRRRRRQQQRQQTQEEEEEGKKDDDNDNDNDIICYSGLGGRVDQAMSQLHHLYMFQRQRPSGSTDDEEKYAKWDLGGGEDHVEEGEEGGEEEEAAEGGYGNGRMYLTNGESLTFVLLAGRQHRIRIRDSSHDDDHSSGGGREKKQNKALTFGKHVGIIPLAGPSELTTRGLEWDVDRWRTAFGERLSTSNHTTPGADVVEIEVAGRDVLFTIDVPVLSASDSD